MQGRNFSLNSLTAQPGGRVAGATEVRRYLEPALAYYLHKLLRANLDRVMPLQVIDPQMCFDTLDALDMLLCQVYPDAEAIQTAVRILAQLVPSHQILSRQRSRYHHELRRTENQIFALLGFHLQAVTDLITVLVIDDGGQQLPELEAILSQGDYEVCHSTTDGVAIALIQEICPDLIVLGDVGKRASEICQRLQALFLTRHVPVLFVDVKNNGYSAVHGFDLGCVDAITHPFQAEEVLTRVGTHVQLRSLRKRLEMQNVLLRREGHDRRDAETRYHELVERSADGIFQSTHEGRFLRGNQPLAKMLGYASPEQLVTEITNIGQKLYVKPQRRSQWLEALQQHGMIENFESQVYRQDGSSIWISESVYAVKDVHGNALFYEGVVREIGDRKRAEVARQRVEKYLELQCAITRILSGWEPGMDAQNMLLEFLGNGLGWQLGELWMVDNAMTALRCVDSWHDGSPAMQAFQAATSNLSFAPGVGLPGRVWLGSDTIWIEDIVKSSDFLRGPLATKAQFHAALGVPIVSRGQVLGVMTFFNHQVQETDTHLLIMMKAIGHQIGQFLERKRLEVALRQKHPECT